MKTYALHLLKTILFVALSLPLQAQMLPCTFVATPDSSSPSTVHFAMNPAVGGNIVWDFGDGTSGTGAVISHTFNSFGPYNVCASVMDSTGHMVCRFCDMINPGGGTGSGCAFNFNPDPADSLGVIFNAVSGPHAMAVWDFGDSTSATGLHVPHHYAAPGTYTVCMTLTDTINGSPVTCTSCKQVMIHGGGPNGNLCSFHVSSAPMGPNTLMFSAIALPGSVINWSFGDGTGGQGPQISHTYLHPGTYQVCMTERDSLGNIICNFCHPVMVNGNPGAPCQFTFSPSALNYLTINFNSHPPAGTTMNWDFGDSTTASGGIVNHTFAGPGIYNVCNTLLDSAGNTLCHNCVLVNVHGMQPRVCHANFHAINLGLTGYFIDASSNVNPATASYSWDFGDGSTANVRFPQHLYAAPGVYNVCLDITDSACNDHFCRTLVVDTNINQPVFCNAFFVTLQMAPYQLVVVNMSSGINLNFQWDFGDGTISNQRYPTHTYTNTGTYILCLTVNSNSPAGALCTSTYCDTVTVDSTGHIYRLSSSGFTVNVVSPDQITGIESLTAETFSAIYPNPVEDQLFVQIANKGVCKYRVYSVNGAEISNGTFNSELNVLKTSGWKPGFYFIEITGNDGTRNYQKILKN